MSSRISTLDASFLYNETASTPMHVASVQRMALPADTQFDTFIDQLRAHIYARRFALPFLTQKLERAPGSWLNPAWVTDDAFDINQHVRTEPVDAPGDLQALEQTVARLHEQPLDRSRPLWDLIVIHGLNDGTVAYYHRIHHACIDGMAGQAATQLLMDESEVPEARTYPARPRCHAPSPMEAMVDGYFSALQSAAEQAYSWPAAVSTWQHMQRHFFDPTSALTQAVHPAPATPLNGPISSKRVYAVCEFPVARLKQVAKSSNATINDVLLTLCGGALRRHLGKLGELPDQSLQAGVPVSLRSATDQRMNNQVTMMRVALGTHIDVPAARLQFVARASAKAKSICADTSALTTLRNPQPGLPVLSEWNARQSDFAARAGFVNTPPINVVISNVPGPRTTLYSVGARMLTHYPVSIPAHGVGVNITAQSYDDQLYIGITAAVDALPNAGELRDDLVREYDTLMTNVDELKVPAKAPPLPSAPTSTDSDRRVA